VDWVVAVVNAVMNFGFHIRQGICVLPKQLSVLRGELDV
jgi:hypothetical protein